MTCAACGDSGKDSRGFPCSACVAAGRVIKGNAYVLMPVKREPTLADIVRELREKIAGEERVLAGPTRLTDEQRAESERLSKELQLRRLREEIAKEEELERDEKGMT